MGQNGESYLIIIIYISKFDSIKTMEDNNNKDDHGGADNSAK